jgi:hypothetical protein
MWSECNPPVTTLAAFNACHVCAGQCISYTIKSGDSLFLIASRLGTTPHQIRRDNNFEDPSGKTIFTGSNLRICRGAPAKLDGLLGLGRFIQSPAQLALPLSA